MKNSGNLTGTNEINNLTSLKFLSIATAIQKNLCLASCSFHLFLGRKELIEVPLSYYTDNLIEAGCDEAGRGCLAGPVFAAAVILPKNYKNNILNDSKKLSEKTRYILRKEIEEVALAWAVGTYSPQEIDKVNILNASIFSMHRAISKLKVKPEFLLIDGNRFKPYQDIPHECIIKGDSKYLSIAAASVLAKTYRDDFMMHIHEKTPQYHWNSNKGYPTKQHKLAIKQYGITSHHRKTFSNLGSVYYLNFDVDK